jgi:hypothetical protein
MPSAILAGARSAAKITVVDPTERVEPGQIVTFSATIFNEGVETDPTSLTFTLRDPQGTEVLYTYGSNAEMEHKEEEPGRYSITLVIPHGATSVGAWAWAWRASGDFVHEVLGETQVQDEADTVTLTVQNEEAEPAEDMTISVFQGQTFIAQRKTNELGQAKFNLPDGRYEVESRLAGWRAPTVYLVVKGPSAAIITAQRLVHHVVPVLKLCRIYGHVIDSGGQAIPGVKVWVQPVGMSMRAWASSGVGANPYNQGVSREQRGTIARSSDGYWEFDLLQNTVVRIFIPDTGLQRIVTVPEVNAINLAEITQDTRVSRVGYSREGVPFV